MKATQLVSWQPEGQRTRLLTRELPGDFCESHWYVAQTCARHEKRIAEQLNVRGIEHFLPLYEMVSQWKDRRVKLQLPLFPGYIFVRVPLQERLQVLEIPTAKWKR
jgi:hypothetical protein